MDIHDKSDRLLLDLGKAKELTSIICSFSDNVCDLNGQTPELKCNNYEWILNQHRVNLLANLVYELLDFAESLASDICDYVYTGKDETVEDKTV